MSSSLKVSIYALLIRLKNFLPRHFKVRLFLLIFLMVFSAFAEIISIGLIVPFLSAITNPSLIFESDMIQPVLSFFSIESDYSLIIFLTIAFCIGAITSAGLRLITLWVQTRFCYSIGAYLSSQIYKNSLYQSYSVHLSRNSSEFISTIVSKTSASTSFAILPSLNVLSSSFVLLAIILALMLIQPMVAFTTFSLFAFLYGGVILLTRKKLDSDSEKISYEQDQAIKILQEGFGSIRDILVSNTQEVYLEAYSVSFNRLQRAWSNVEIIKGIPRYAIEALSVIAISLLALFFYSQPNGVIGAIPILGAMALGAQRMLPILQLLYSSFSSLRAGYASLSDVLELLEEPSNETLIKSSNNEMSFKNKISIKNLKFRYSPDGLAILDGIDLEISKGSMIGVIGATGSGKSTLIDIVMGLLQPSSGDFIVDDIVITETNKLGWQSQIAHVPQAIFLADISIAENIALGVSLDEIDYDLVKDVAKQAQIHGSIMSWSDGYSTIVGERGARISGGQRQRIGIARALYKKASVIILDEATSALDSETEISVMQSIMSSNEDLTFIIVAHRLNTLQGCTKIIELSEGKISRQGLFSEIIK